MKETLRTPRADAPFRLGRDAIDQIAVQALGFLAADQDRLVRFFDITGLTLRTLRDAAATPEFAASLLDYLASDETLLRAFADENGYQPDQVDAVRMRVSRPDRD